GPLLAGRSAAAGDRGRGLDDVVDEAVLERLGGGEPAVAVGVAVDLVDGLAGLLRGDLGEHALHVEDELGVDPDVGGGAADAAGGLVHHDAGVGRGVPLALGARGEQELPHRGGHTHGDGGDVGL